jgi:hypothetical protein
LNLQFLRGDLQLISTQNLENSSSDVCFNYFGKFLISDFVRLNENLLPSKRTTLFNEDFLFVNRWLL